MTAPAPNIVPFRSQAERITRENLLGRKTTNAIHYDTSTEAVRVFGVEGIPRLGVADVYQRSKKSERRWSIDGRTVRGLDAALAVLNGEKTLEEAVSEAAEQEIPAHAHRPGKVSLDAQIEEVDRELGERKKVYERIAAGNPSQRSKLEFQTQRLQAVRATLVWLRENEASIKQRASY